jgi:hypothetical protein
MTGAGLGMAAHCFAGMANSRVAALMYRLTAPGVQLRASSRRPSRVGMRLDVRDVNFALE